MAHRKPGTAQRMGTLDAIVSGLFGRKERIGTAAALAGFVEARAAFLSQKCVVEFCRVRSGVYWQKLFSEAEFREALTRSCWNSFAPATAMLLEMIEGELRGPAGVGRLGLSDALTGVAREVFQRHPVPLGAENDFWEEGLRVVRERLEAVRAEPARPVRNVAEPMAKLIHQALPLHATLVTHDYDYIRNNLRMNLLRAHEDFIALVDADALVEDLLGRAAR